MSDELGVDPALLSNASDGITKVIGELKGLGISSCLFVRARYRSWTMPAVGPGTPTGGPGWSSIPGVVCSSRVHLRDVRGG